MFSSPEIKYLLKEGAQSHWTEPVLPQRNASSKMVHWKKQTVKRETRRLLLITTHKRGLTSFIWELNHQDLTSLFFYCKEAHELH